MAIASEGALVVISAEVVGALVVGLAVVVGLGGVVIVVAVFKKHLFAEFPSFPPEIWRIPPAMRPPTLRGS